MRQSGIEIGSHGQTHLFMSSLDYGRLVEEFAFSKKRIEEMTNSTLESFSYPFGNTGSFDQLTEKTARETGYKKTYTNLMGTLPLSSDNYLLPRIRIYPEDNLFRFKLKVAGAYNWVDVLGRFLRPMTCF
mgnify:FL=1